MINVGVHFPFQFSIDSIDNFSIVSSDSTPIIPYSGVNKVMLHNGERYVIVVNILTDILNGLIYWIRVDTLESRKHGYENGIGGTLHVIDDILTVADIYDNDVLDPDDSIKLGKALMEERVTMNCYSQLKTKKEKRSRRVIVLQLLLLKHERLIKD